VTRRRALALSCLGASLTGGCAGLTVRSPDAADEHAHRAGAVQLRWRTELHQHGLFEPTPEECASGAVTGGKLVIGSRAGSIVAVDTEHGHIEWATQASGGIDSQARYDAAHDQVYVGSDDGTLFAVEPGQGKVRWSYHAKGAIERPPEVGGDMVYLATAADKVFALEAATGKWRWQYDRETPEGFTIHGYAGPRVFDPAAGAKAAAAGDSAGRSRAASVLAGFADGYLVSLDGGSGEVVWARSLAAASDQFVDVDSTPTIVGDVVYASSYSGGLYALDARDGTIRWRIGIEGVGTVRALGERLYFAAPREGLHAATLDGHVVWRQGLTQAGDLTTPTAAGRLLVFSGSRAGLFIVDRDSGKLLDVFNPGSGICAPATLDPAGGRLYVLSNGGALYALDLAG